MHVTLLTGLLAALAVPSASHSWWAGGAWIRLAPPAALQAQFDLAGSSDKTLVVFGRDRGDQMDYGHGDLVYGQGAPAEVYPLLRRWLEAHATPLDGG